MLDPFVCLLAVGPLVVYLAAFGLMRILGWVWVTSVSVEIMTLGFALMGFVAIGPAELFFPRAASAFFGPVVWVAVLMLYFLCVSLYALTRPMKLCVYGLSAADLYQPLLQAASNLDREAEGINERLQVRMPNSGIQIRVDGYTGVQYAQVTTFEPNLSLQFWLDLHKHLRAQVINHSARHRTGGWMMLTVAAALAILVALFCVDQPDQLAEGFKRWLYRL
ncbi:MAG: hypothetical protein AAGA03_00630 [Planctomycetota bacterium]